MAKKTFRDALPRHWVHSHEEDTDTEKVFRPAAYNFPPARGRSSFELKQNGNLIEYKIGPTDRPGEGEEGTWELVDEHTLAFYPTSSRTARKVLHIVRVSEDRLVIKK
jgi:hypothetical protein